MNEDLCVICLSTLNEDDTYNLSFDKRQKPKRNAEVFKDADVVVIPSDSEFR